MTAPRVVCLGEALVDLIATDAGGRNWRAVPGGAPCNAAVAAGRLGAPTTFLGVLSDDRFGQMLRSHLRGSNVECGTCPTTTEPTTLTLVGPGDGDFDFHVAGTTTTSNRVNDLHLPIDLGILHVSGSVSLVIEPAASRLEGLLAAAQHRALIHLDANPRPKLVSRDRYLRRFGHWLAMADVVKISAADVEWMAPGAHPVETTRQWLEAADDGVQAPSVVVLTRGADGASVIRADGVVDVAAPHVEVVDTVGAGDTFSGAVLAALASHQVRTRPELDALDLGWWRIAATYAIRAASIACSRPGADPPRRNELH